MLNSNYKSGDKVKNTKVQQQAGLVNNDCSKAEIIKSLQDENCYLKKVLNSYIQIYGSKVLNEFSNANSQGIYL